MFGASGLMSAVGEALVTKFRRKMAFDGVDNRFPCNLFTDLRFLAGTFWRESFSGLPSPLTTSPRTKQPITVVQLLPITCFNDVVDRPIPTLTIKPDYSFEEHHSHQKAQPSQG
eukprot:scaffold4095_cov82-Skeletonema_dohrnii-CCMP3373.AAC.4